MASGSRRLTLSDGDWDGLLADRACVREVVPLERPRKRARVDFSSVDTFANLRGSQIYRWLMDGSWGFCVGCLSVFRRELGPPAFGDAREKCCSEVCPNCSGHYLVPDWREIPLPLRGLSAVEVLALRPVVVHQGESPVGHRAGFLRHRQAIRFSWKESSVEDCIAQLEGEAAHRAGVAFAYLMSSEQSAYKDFVAEHRTWLRGSSQVRLPFFFLLRRYIENALWPDLYPFKTWCDTLWAGSEYPRHSVKASFLVKVTSSVCDYAASWELLHFQYDRWILSKFTGRAAMAKHISLKYALRDIPETPFHSYIHHMHLVDMHRQYGPASFWVTVAPGLHTFPQHAWVTQQGCVSGKRVSRNGTAESMHIHHCMSQVIQTLDAFWSQTVSAHHFVFLRAIPFGF